MLIRRKTESYIQDIEGCCESLKMVGVGGGKCGIPIENSGGDSFLSANITQTTI